MLNTVEFGLICIVDMSDINPRFDTLIGYDLMCEWAFWQLVDGEVVAVEVEDEEDFDDYEDDFDEVGFNPYMGCYDYDC